MEEVIFPMPQKMEGAVYPLIGAYFYDELVKDIEACTNTIYAVQYQWKWTSHERHSRVQRLGACIIRSKRRGVDVHVLLNNESPKANLSKINRITADQLEREGVHTRLLRVAGLLHTKLWIFDSRVVYVGSHNISSRALGVNEEVSVKIESTEVAKYMQTYFDNLWGSR